MYIFYGEFCFQCTDTKEKKLTSVCGGDGDCWQQRATVEIRRSTRVLIFLERGGSFCFLFLFWGVVDSNATSKFSRPGKDDISLVVQPDDAPPPLRARSNRTKVGETGWLLVLVTGWTMTPTKMEESLAVVVAGVLGVVVAQRPRGGSHGNRNRGCAVQSQFSRS